MTYSKKRIKQVRKSMKQFNARNQPKPKQVNSIEALTIADLVNFYMKLKNK